MMLNYLHFVSSNLPLEFLSEHTGLPNIYVLKYHDDSISAHTGVKMFKIASRIIGNCIREVQNFEANIKV
jgi:hypothetical protein